MQGRILEIDSMGAGGLILGNDGNRYAFVIAEWRAADRPYAGATVDFVVGPNSTAGQIFPLPAHPTHAFTAPQQQGGAWGSQQGAPAPQGTLQPGAPLPPTYYARPPEGGGNSVLLGILGLVFLLLGFVVPFVPTIVAFILGLVGADSGKRYKNTAGVVLSRIAWIGALVLFIVMIVFIGFFIAMLGSIYGFSPEDWQNWSAV